MKLGVNVDHIATLRQARKIVEYPSPVAGALIAQFCGADSIVMHLRKDRRHIHEKDIFLAKELLEIDFNLEMSIDQEIVDIACELKPVKVTIVPERRQEITTEGGFDIKKYENRFKKAQSKLIKAGIEISVFIDPVISQIEQAKRLKVKSLELHTGKYATARSREKINKEFQRLARTAEYAYNQGFFVAAGHGLNYENTNRIKKIKYIKELNIGHSIIAYSVITGLPGAVKRMKQLIK
jgi:pyridoxine 5-phosphate synthase